MGQLPVFLTEPARCEIRGEAMFFIWDDFTIALPISTCIANMASASEALAQHEYEALGGGKVVRIPRRRK